MPFVSVPNEELCDEYVRIRDGESPDFLRGWMTAMRHTHGSAWCGHLIMAYDWRHMHQGCSEPTRCKERDKAECEWCMKDAD